MGIEKEIPDEKRKEKQLYIMAKFISTLITVIGVLMSITCYFNKFIYLSVFSLIYAIIFVFVFIYTVLSKKLIVFYISIILLTFSFEISYVITGGAAGFSPIWLTIVPLFAIYIFNMKSFYIINALILSILIIFMWTPLSNHIYDYGDIFLIRFPIIYAIEFVFGIFLKYRIENTEKRLEEQRNTLQKEIENAALLQKTFLSREEEFWEHWSVCAKSIPMAGVTGDLNCAYGDNHNLLGLGIFDISGHGIASGLLTMLAKNIIEYQFYENVYSNGKEELWETMDKINSRFIKNKGEVSNYLTGILLKITDNKIELVNAGHPEPILYKKSLNSFIFFARDSRAIGVIGMNNIPPFYISQYLEMESGDELFLFTDGITECTNDNGEQFGQARLMKAFQNYIRTPIEEQIKLIMEEVNDFRGKTITDDITLMILKRD